MRAVTTLGRSRTRRSLHIGINYEGTSAALYGCVNDAHDWRDWAVEGGYAPILLIERQASKAAIVAALTELRDSVGWGGRALITISSHGTPVPDRDGDEIDGYDEAFVPYDYRTAGVLTDDEMFAVLGRRRLGSRWLTVADACFSGTLQRFALGFDGEDRMLGRRVRYLPPGEALVGDRRGEFLRNLPADTRVAARGVSRTSGVLLSGAGEHEYAYDAEFAQRPNGAFTRAALDAARALPPTATLADLHDAIRKTLPSSQFPQTPQLQANPRQRRWALRD